MKLGTWNFRSLYRADSLKTATRGLARYKLGWVDVQVRWDKRGTVGAGDYNFFYGKEKKIIIWEKSFFLYIIE